MINYIYLDIETCPSEALASLFIEGIKPNGTLKDPEKIKEDLAKKHSEAKEKMCVDKDFSRIKLIGLRYNGEYHRLTLEDFANYILPTNSVFVTFNGLKFDFPVIIRGLVKLGLSGDAITLKKCLERFSPYHIDLMDRLCGYGEWKSLDHYSQVYLGKAKKEIDFLACSDEELEEHNREDLELLEELHKKFINFI